jgi:hypothetical protein
MCVYLYNLCFVDLVLVALIGHYSIKLAVHELELNYYHLVFGVFFISF